MLKKIIESILVVALRAMQSYEPGVVYKNLLLMLTKYRGYKMTTPELDDAGLSQRLNSYEFHPMTCVRDDPSHPLGPGELTVLLIAPGSSIASKSADFKKLLKGYPKGNVLIVSETALTSHINKFIETMRDRVEVRGYFLFLDEKPAHVSVPPHFIATADEIAELESRYIFKDNLPRIVCDDDPIAIWIGARPGMVIKIHRSSETVGIAIAYRLGV